MNEVPGTLKDALHSTIHRHDSLTVEAIAEQLNMTPSYLYRAALPDPDTDGPNASGVRFPLKQLVPLIRVTGDYQVLDQVEFTLGRVAIPIPKPGTMTSKDIQANALDAVVQFGELMKELQSSLNDDGKISSREQKRIDKEGREAIQAITLLLSIKSNL